LVVTNGDIDNAPEVPEGENPSPLHFFAFNEDQLSIPFCPAVIRLGLALSVTIGAGGGGDGGVGWGDGEGCITAWF